MKRFAVIGAAVILMGVASLNAAPAPTPVATISVPREVNARLKQQLEQIQKDFHAKKLTQAEANTARATVKSIRQQELQFFKTNGNKNLTAAQESQLNASLDANQSSI